MSHPKDRGDRRRIRRALGNKRVKSRPGWFAHLEGRDLDRAKGLVASTNTLCSCHMCGNPRKRFGEQTLHEDRADLDLADWLDNTDPDCA